MFFYLITHDYIRIPLRHHLCVLFNFHSHTTPSDYARQTRSAASHPFAQSCKVITFCFANITFSPVYLLFNYSLFSNWQCLHIDAAPNLLIFQATQQPVPSI